MSTKKSSLGPKEQIAGAAMMLGIVGLFQVHSQLKDHMEDCSRKSALLVKIVSGVAVLVLGELILRGLGMLHGVAQ